MSLRDEMRKAADDHRHRIAVEDRQRAVYESLFNAVHVIKAKLPAVSKDGNTCYSVIVQVLKSPENRTMPKDETQIRVEYNIHNHARTSAAMMFTIRADATVAVDDTMCDPRFRARDADLEQCLNALAQWCGHHMLDHTETLEKIFDEIEAKYLKKRPQTADETPAIPLSPPGRDHEIGLPLKFD